MSDAVERFLAELPEPRRPDGRALCELVVAAAPELRPAVHGKVLGFGTYAYRYDSGRTGPSYVVGIAATSRGWSVYVDAVEDGSYLPERAADRLGRVTVGRSCIRLRTAEDVDLEALAELVGRAARLRAPELTG